MLESEVAITQDSLLQAAPPAADAVTFDIYWVRMPHTSDGEDGGLWDRVYEDRLPAELRRRLAENGLRAGVVGATPPDVLLRLIDPNQSADVSAAGTTDLRETGVRRRTRQMRPGQELELNASEVLPEATLKLAHDDQLEEVVYEKAQGVYLLETAWAEDDRVWVSLLPSIRHGNPRLSFATDETGVISRGSMKREAKALPDLAIAADLAPGEMLLVTNLPGSSAKLGGLLHTPPSDAGCQRRAMVVRVAGAPATRPFLPDEAELLGQ